MMAVPQPNVSKSWAVTYRVLKIGIVKRLYDYATA
eukprot:13171.XXX_321386_321490_1 [CDS] Oithona nana genome sequencing.